ncbi:MAG: hypothetical protein ABFC71_09040 [Methanoregula sp.]
MNAHAGIAVVVLACLVLGTGCASAPSMENLTAPEIAKRYVQAQESVQDLSATVVITTDYYPGTDLYSIREKVPHNFRIEYLAPGSEANGTLVLSNGTYNATLTVSGPAWQRHVRLHGLHHGRFSPITCPISSCIGPD